MAEREALKVSTRVMYDELRAHNIATRIIDASSSLLEFTDNGGENHLLFSTLCDKSSAVGLAIANSKRRTSLLARRLDITVPADTICYSFDDAKEFLLTHKRVVLKPINNSGGNGVSTNITTVGGLRTAYSYAHKFSDTIVAQQHIIGRDLRLLVVAGKFCSAVERRPAQVTGDGALTIRDLINRANASPDRSDNYMTTLSTINLESAKRYLSKDIDTVPARGEKITVVGPANLSLGGTAHEMSSEVSTEMIATAELIAKRLCLGICGVYMIWDTDNDQYFLIEVNATPGIDLHNDPAWGTSSDASSRYVQWLIDPDAAMKRD